MNPRWSEQDSWWSAEEDDGSRQAWDQQGEPGWGPHAARAASGSPAYDFPSRGPAYDVGPPQPPPYDFPSRGPAYDVGPPQPSHDFPSRELPAYGLAPRPYAPQAYAPRPYAPQAYAPRRMHPRELPPGGDFAPSEFTPRQARSHRPAHRADPDFATYAGPDVATDEYPVIEARPMTPRRAAPALPVRSRQAMPLPVHSRHDMPVPRQRRPVAQRRETRRRHTTIPQRLGSLVIAMACVAGAVWYIPRIVASDQHSMVGTVTSTGIADLNFAAAGQISNINVQVGQQVKKGQVLATEYAPSNDAIVKADQAAIDADQAKIAQVRAQPGPGQQAALAAANAQLAKDQEQLQNDEANLGRTRIVASADGTVVAVNGQPGEAVTTQGIRTFQSVSGSTPVGQQPQFSLLPQGPQSNLKSTGSAAELPVVALRTSADWRVVILIPQSQVSRIKAGQRVKISVPSAGISGIRGQIVEVLPTPQSTNQGVAYQAVVSVTGRQARAPLSGMSADVDLDS